MSSTPWMSNSCLWRPLPPTAAVQYTNTTTRAPCKAGIAVLFGAMLLAGTARAADSRGGVDHAPFYANSFERQPAAAALTALGRDLFLNPALSASGKLACATCHDPQHDFGPANTQAVQRGGSDGRSPGIRAVPALKYTQNVPSFTQHFFDDEGDDSVDQGPAGGRTWDGRSQSVHEQARLPLFSVFEMANTDVEAVVIKVRNDYGSRFRRIFGEHVFADDALAFK